mmetsp:Transcript_9926/g.23961  ORF Transcript_9926/g.23961 Transcript_9926/m.23961 type:complete len:231 (-) Transcript_9926:186-878(-)
MPLENALDQAHATNEFLWYGGGLWRRLRRRLWRRPHSLGSSGSRLDLSVIKHSLYRLGDLFGIWHKKRDLEGLRKCIQRYGPVFCEGPMSSNGLLHSRKSFSPQAFDDSSENVGHRLHCLVKFSIRYSFVSVCIQIELDHLPYCHSYLGPGCRLHHLYFFHGAVDVMSKPAVYLVEAFLGSPQVSDLLSLVVQILLVTFIVFLELFHLLMQEEVGDDQIGVHHEKNATAE